MEYTYLRSKHSGGTVTTKREVQLAYSSERLAATSQLSLWELRNSKEVKFVFVLKFGDFCDTVIGRADIEEFEATSCHKPVIPVGTLKFERSKVCIRTEYHTFANTSRSFVTWEGGPSPNPHASATPPRIWNLPIYGANIAAGLSGQREKCS